MASRSIRVGSGDLELPWKAERERTIFSGGSPYTHTPCCWTQNDQIRHGDTWGKAGFRGSSWSS